MSEPILMIKGRFEKLVNIHGVERLEAKGWKRFKAPKKPKKKSEPEAVEEFDGEMASVKEESNYE